MTQKGCKVSDFVRRWAWWRVWTLGEMFEDKKFTADQRGQTFRQHVGKRIDMAEFGVAGPRMRKPCSVQA